MSYMFQYLQNVINKTSEFKEKQKKKYFFTFRKKKQKKELQKNSYFSLHDNVIHKILNE